MELSSSLYGKAIFLFKEDCSVKVLSLPLSTISYSILVELVKLAMLINSLNQSYISAKRIEEVFAEAPEDIHSELEKKQVTSNQVLQVQELTFTYPDAAQPSLRDISFDMKQGQILGIIGGTGSGKSSLVTAHSSSL